MCTTDMSAILDNPGYLNPNPQIFITGVRFDPRDRCITEWWSLQLAVLLHCAVIVRYWYLPL